MSAWAAIGNFIDKRFEDISDSFLFLVLIGVDAWFVKLLIGNPELSDGVMTLLTVAVTAITVGLGLAAKEKFGKKGDTKPLTDVKEPEK